tara:strand:+ start:794 stop:2899 length:2106 start_codon:yes stop_codon:yes gene_type:complete
MPTKIGWTNINDKDGKRIIGGETWNCIAGCTIKSTGCRSCYAMKMAWRLQNNPKTKYYQGTVKETSKGNILWTGQVNLVPAKLDQPIRWKRPRMIFTNSMSDLFHEEVPDDFLDAMFGVMLITPRHVYQNLTKRPERMKEYISGRIKYPNDAQWRIDIANAWKKYGIYTEDRDVELTLNMTIQSKDEMGKLPQHIGLGISCEDQATADERIPILASTPANFRFLSIEPILERIHIQIDDCLDKIHWCIVGGECLSANTLIHTPKGPKQITEIKSNDVVFSNESSIITDGKREYIQTEFKPVKVNNLIYSGKKTLFELRTNTRRIKASENHRFLRLTRKRKEGKQENRRYDKQLEWVQLSDIQENDLILIQRCLPDNGIPYVLPNGNRTTKDFMQIIGCFIGDGYVTDRMVGFCLEKGYKDGEKYIKLIEKVFNKQVKYLKSGKQINIYDTYIANLFRQLDIDYKALKKHIPEWIWTLPIEQKKAFLEGYIDTDGCIQENYVSFETPNKKLMQQMRQLCIDCNYYVANLYERERIRGKWIVNNKIYEYNNPQKSYGFKAYLDRVGYNSTLYNGGHKIMKTLKNTEFALDRVKSITEIGEQDTWDLSVDEPHNFIADGIVTHNSGVGARDCNIKWLKSILRQSKNNYNLPVFVKQLGANPVAFSTIQNRDVKLTHIKDKKGADINEFPEELKVQEFPEFMIKQ